MSSWRRISWGHAAIAGIAVAAAVLAFTDSGMMAIAAGFATDAIWFAAKALRGLEEAPPALPEGPPRVTGLGQREVQHLTKGGKDE